MFRVRIQLVAGPPPSGPVTLYAREDDIVSWSGSTARSVPTPADAAGSISIAAVDWRSNSLVRYSSRGPTADGRLKPDLAAPTGTSLATPAGDPRDVGGTSIAAPNAAGAAAVALATMRGSGLRPTVAEFRAILAADAVDLGDPGPDNTFGAGRIRVDVEPPVLRPVVGVPASPVRGIVRLGVEATDAGRVATWTLLVDGVRARVGRVAREVVAPNVPTRPLPDGPHRLELQIADAVGNASRRRWSILVDNTPPEIELRSVDVIRRVQAATPPVLRPVRLRVAVTDAIAKTVRLRMSLTAVRGGRVVRREASVAVARPRDIVVGRVRPGLYVLRVGGRRHGGQPDHAHPGVAGRRVVASADLFAGSSKCRTAGTIDPCGSPLERVSSSPPWPPSCPPPPRHLPETRTGTSPFPRTAGPSTPRGRRAWSAGARPRAARLGPSSRRSPPAASSRSTAARTP